MKRFFCLLFVSLFLFSACSVSCAEYPLSENEQKYVGAWCLYATKGKNTYTLVLTFLDSMNVVQSAMTFSNGELTENHKSSGTWCGFTDNSIVFSLAGTDMTATIKDNGYLYVGFFKDMSLCGIYSKCEDMTSVLGW